LQEDFELVGLKNSSPVTLSITSANVLEMGVDWPFNLITPSHREILPLPFHHCNTSKQVL
jgi:hypothetical protein